MSRIERTRATRIWTLLVALAFVTSACTSNGAPEDPLASTSTTTSPSESGFDDHTVSTLSSVEDFFAVGTTGPAGLTVTKFVIPSLGDSASLRWMDGDFYQLHDEWFWFRLLNGEPIPGVATTPVSGLEFSSVADVYSWAESTQDFPLGLRLINRGEPDRRLYSPEFYDLALKSSPRMLAIGSLLHVPASNLSGKERWLVELEYSDEPTMEFIESLLSSVAETVPDQISTELEWVVRSPAQELLAQRLESGDSPLKDRVARFSDLVAPGSATVYNEGVTAGRLLLVGNDRNKLASAADSDILLVEQVPDYLPPASAILSSSPQTALAHINLLARNRGIPNASISGLLEYPAIERAARSRGYAIVRTSANNSVDIVLISKDEYLDWQASDRVEPIFVDPVVRSDLPLALDLVELAQEIETEGDLAQWRPVIGGKSAGFLALLAARDVTTPEDPFAITVAAYIDHLDQVRHELAEILADSEFRESDRVRFLVLEGPESFAQRYTTEADADFLAAYQSDHRVGTPIGDVLAAGGFGRFFRNVDMDEANLAEITSALKTRFGHYSTGQGLRFRSSSSVEDIEGFNGAGLYDSNTGFLNATIQEKEKDQKKTIEWAIKKTWASYWSFEAFEERERERINHLSGSMAVLVHARFDDPLELNNGVATLTLLPGDGFAATINAQLGEVSVTNPDPDNPAQPEVIEVRTDQEGNLQVERIVESSLATTGPVLDDESVSELIAQLSQVAKQWRDWTNASLVPEQRVTTVTLDFEFKNMDSGWPAVDDGSSPKPARLIVKQARSLDPGLRRFDQRVLDLPVPLDVLARADLVQSVTCQNSDESWVEVYTNPLLLPDLGYSDQPFTTFAGQEADLSDCQVETRYSGPTRMLTELLEGEDHLVLFHQ